MEWHLAHMAKLSVGEWIESRCVWPGLYLQAMNTHICISMHGIYHTHTPIAISLFLLFTWNFDVYLTDTLDRTKLSFWQDD